MCQCLLCQRLLIHPIEVMLLLRPVNGDSDREVLSVLLNEPLHLWRVVIDAIGGERKTVGVKPVVVQFEHAGLEVVANLVDKFNLQEWFPTDEVPYYAFLAELRLTAQHIVNKCLRRLPRHPLLNVLPHQIAILASQLAVLSDNEGNAFRPSFLPSRGIFFNSNHL